MTTLRDIAEHLDLSVSTVSRVLGGKGRVGEATIARVLAYTREVDYHPNEVARQLKAQASNTVGVVVPDIGNEFYARLFQDIDKCLEPRGYTPILFNIGGRRDREAEFLKHLRSATVDSMVVATAGSDVYQHLHPATLARIVFVDNMPTGNAKYSYIGVDNINSSRVLTDHLIERGHKDIAMITGPSEESSAVERTVGFHQSMDEHHLPVREDWVVTAPFEYSEGYTKARKLLSERPRPTAILAQNNVLAYATIRAVRDERLGVPGDVAVACFDHIDTYNFMRPVITTILQPLDQIAEQACGQLDLVVEQRPSGNTPILQATFRQGETT